jgi:rhodanese-related sulfurtransferase
LAVAFTNGYGKFSAWLRVHFTSYRRKSVMAEPVRTITPKELQQLLDAESGVIVLDVRTPAEYATAHVPAARSEPLDGLSPQMLLKSGQVSKDKPVYLLCQAGGRAAKAAERFSAEGFARPIVVQGGTSAWIDAGLPVTRGGGKVISLERQVRIAAGSLVVVGVLLTLCVHPAFIALPAFVGVGLVFAGITDFCGMGLLLAKLPWNTRKGGEASPLCGDCLNAVLGGNQSLIEGLETLRNDASAADDGHEIRITQPAWDDVEVKMVFNAGATGLTEIPAHVEALCLYADFEKLLRVHGELPEFDDLGLCEIGQVCHLPVGRCHEMPGGVGVLVHDEEGRLAPGDDQMLGIVVGLGGFHQKI